MIATPPFAFVQITDLHVGFTVVQSADVLAADLHQIENEVGDRVAFIVATGDLTNIGTEAECRVYLEAANASRFEIHPVVGNHDYVNGGWQAGKWDAAWYQKLIAPLNYSFDFNGVHFISYDYTNQEPVTEPTPLPFDQLKTAPSRWLLDDLSALPEGTPVILLVHDQLPAAFFDPLRPFHIVATLSGHWHSSRLYHDGRITHFNSPSLCFGGIDYSPRAYRLFTWDGHGLSCKTIAMSRAGDGHNVTSHTRSSVLSTQSFRETWRAPLGGEVLRASPVARNGRVLLGLMDEDRPNNGAVACWDSRTGHELWRVRLDASVKNTLALTEEAAIAVTVTGEVAALNPHDGRRIWTYQLGDPSRRWIFSSPLVHNGRVFVGQGPHFACLDAATGQPNWVRTDLTLSDWISSYISPASDQERVFIGFHWQANSMQALDPGTGKTLWKLDGKLGETSAVSSPVPDRGALFVVRQTGLSKFEAASGTLLWEFPLGELWSPAAPCVSGNTVYAASGTGKVFAVDAISGKEMWQWETCEDLSAMHPYRRTGKTLLSSPVLMGGQLLIGSNDGRLVALDHRTGQPLWAHEFDAPVTNSPSITVDTIFLAVRDGNLYAFARSQLPTH